MDELRKERLNLSQMISAELCCILPVYKLFSLLESWFPSYLSREEFCPSMSRRLDDVMVCRVTLCELHHSESSLLKEYSFVFKLPSFCLHLSSNMLVTCSTKKWLRYHLMWTTPPQKICSSYYKLFSVFLGRCGEAGRNGALSNCTVLFVGEERRDVFSQIWMSSWQFITLEFPQRGGSLLLERDSVSQEHCRWTAVRNPFPESQAHEPEFQCNYWMMNIWV